MRKRLTAVLLTLCMMLTLLPAPAYAAVGDLLGNSPAANQELLDQQAAGSSGYQIDSHQIVFQGLCPSCQEHQ